MNRKTFLTSILAGIGLTVKAKEVAVSAGDQPKLVRSGSLLSGRPEKYFIVCNPSHENKSLIYERYFNHDPSEALKGEEAEHARRAIQETIHSWERDLNA